MQSVTDMAQPLGENFLHEETRRHRRNLDLVAVASLLVVFLDLVPTKISTLGVDLTKTDQRGVLAVLLAFDLAFLARFLIHASSDFVVYRDTSTRASREIEALEAQEFERMGWVDRRLEDYLAADPSDRAELAHEIKGQPWELARELQRARTLIALRRIGWLRFVSDFVAPVVLGNAAAVALLLELI
jgi:hypothetical protein